MGLSLVVYRNYDNLAPHVQQAPLVHYECTGQWLLKDGILPRLPDECFQAARFYVGNASRVAELRATATEILPADSLVLNGILNWSFSGGPDISENQLDQLQQELDALDAHARKSGNEQLQEFVDGMLGLLKAARHESNPIVFV